MIRYLEWVEPAQNHNKFWQMEVVGKKHYVHFGRIGTAGQTQVKALASEKAALERAEIKVNLKLSEGYTEIKGKYKDASKLKVGSLKDRKVRKADEGSDDEEPKPKSSAKRMRKSIKDDKALDGMVFCFTGALSRPRKEMEALVVAHGGKCASSVTKSVTHLVASSFMTDKAKKAIKSGIAVIPELKLMLMMGIDEDEEEGEDEEEEEEEEEEEKPKKAAKKKAAPAKKKAAAAAGGGAGGGGGSGGGKALGGMVFAITGKLSKPRKDYVSWLESHGGSVASTVTAKVTHLICSDDSTTKAVKAKSQGKIIVDEEAVEDMVAGGGGGGGDDGGDDVDGVKRRFWRPIVSDGEPVEPKASKYGGAPFMETGSAWPQCGCGLEMKFMCQFNLADFPAEKKTLHGSSGLAQLFYCMGDGCPGWEPFTNNGNTMRFVKEDADGECDDTHEMFEPYTIDEWELQDTLDNPHYEDADLNGFDMGENYGDEDEDHPVGDDKLGGWPDWVQGAEYPTCPTCNSTCTYMIQIQPSHVDFTFGDCGTGHISQCPNHKEILGFGWACG